VVTQQPRPDAAQSVLLSQEPWTITGALGLVLDEDLEAVADETGAALLAVTGLGVAATGAVVAGTEFELVLGASRFPLRQTYMLGS